MQNLPLQEILKRLSQLHSRNHWSYKIHVFHFSIFTFLGTTAAQESLTISPERKLCDFKN